jgi:predicted Zn-dependent protease
MKTTSFNRFYRVAFLSVSLLAVPVITPSQAGIFSMSEKDEARIGKEQHPKIMQEFGGAYGDAEIGAYVASVVGRIAKKSPIDAKTVRVTVLNTPVVNAMALPGGFVYATRGLLAMANSEAELAGVMAHEIGHVVARHSAKRYNKATKIGLGGALASILLKSPAVDQLVNMGGTMWILKNSRDDEYEADKLGTKYIAKTGYDPYAMGSFLGALDLQNNLQATLAGKDHNSKAPDYMSTHPNTLDRVRKATEQAKKTGIKKGERPRNEKEYLDRIDGLIYGDDPEQGFIRNQTFSHPELKLTFTAPEGFRLVNSPTAVNAVGPDNTLIRFNFGKNNTPGNMSAHIKKWTEGKKIQNLSKGNMNNMNGAHALMPNFK